MVRTDNMRFLVKMLYVFQVGEAGFYDIERPFNVMVKANRKPDKTG